MDGFVSFKGARLTEDLVRNLRNNLKWSIFTIGKSRQHITKYGGVHYSGQLKTFPAICFEIRRDNAYIMVTLMEYPKGLIMHAHIYYPDINKRNNWKPTMEKLKAEIQQYVKASMGNTPIDENFRNEGSDDLESLY